MEIMNKKLKIAIFISGRGSNMEAIINASKSNDFPAEISLVLSNKPKALGLETAKLNNIPTAIVNHKDFDNKQDFENSILEILTNYPVDLICLAGFMRILSADFLNNYPDKVINIHPSLLPKFKGLNTHKRAIEAKETESGCTVHYVIAEMDAGPIILQKSVPISKNENEETLQAKILEQEHKAYPEAIIKIASKNN